ncbi:MAG: sulfotransferase [Proteobacteria bacterium]|nr:sulfotransferase [Pseudomonadota bacterium]
MAAIVKRLPKQLQAAIDAHRRSDFDTAASAYRKFLQRHDREAGVWHLLASAQLMRGKLPDARDAADRSVALDASKPGHHLLLVDVLLMQSEYAEAIRRSDVLLRLAGPDDEAVWRKARALRLGGDVDAAMQLLQVDGKQGPPFLYEKGLTLEQLDRLGEAEAVFRDATESDPAMAVAWHALGVIQLKQGDAKSAAPSLSRASKLDPENAEVKINLVTAVRLAADIKGALLLSEALLNEHGDLADVHTQYAATLQALGRFPEAEKEFLKARELQKDNVAAIAGLAELAEWRGDYAGGLKLLDEAGELTAPDLIVSRARLLQRSGHAAKAADLLRREEAAGVGWRPWQHAQAGFSLAQILDELGDYPEAFEAATRANLIRGGRFDSSAHTRWVDRVIEQAPTTACEGAETDSRPVFILGMPRSGTSLLEQILSGHSALYAAGELPFIGEIATRTPGWLNAGDNAGELAGLGREYLESLPAEAADATLVSDKMPLNFLYLGLIAAILPGARVIHCLRDPRDVAVSCYFQDFVDPALAFSFDLRQTADYYRDYWRLMGHWRERLARPMLEVHYENLVGDIEKQTRRVLEFLGLPMEPACLSFHEREREVKTASHAQVRRPLYRSSVGRYRNYLEQIERLFCDPLADILEQYQASLNGQG